MVVADPRGRRQQRSRGTRGCGSAFCRASNANKQGLGCIDLAWLSALTKWLNILANPSPKADRLLGDKRRSVTVVWIINPLSKLGQVVKHYCCCWKPQARRLRLSTTPLIIQQYHANLNHGRFPCARHIRKITAEPRRKHERRGTPRWFEGGDSPETAGGSVREGTAVLLSLIHI